MSTDTQTFIKNGLRPGWLRGDLPTWIAVGLLSLVLWLGKEAYQDFKSTLAKTVEVLNRHESRLAVLEAIEARRKERTRYE